MTKSPKHERILDRFIPHKASKSSYRITHGGIESPKGSHEYCLNVRSFPSIPVPSNVHSLGELEDQSLLNLSTTGPADGITALRSTSPKQNKLMKNLEKSSHKSIIANALSLNYTEKVFGFAPSGDTRSNGSSGSGIAASSSSSTYHKNVFNDEFNLSNEYCDADMSIKDTASPKPVIRIQPSDVLAAPYLRNDFYSNLITWSTQSNKIAVGLHNQVCLWSTIDSNVYEPLKDSEDQMLDNISAVSFSQGDYLLVATRLGKIFLYSQALDCTISEINLETRGLSYIAWFPNSLTRFITGDQLGQAIIVEIDSTVQLTMLKQIKCQQQQVCGIAISEDGKQMAVGGNDNCCTLWDIEDIMNPKLQFTLPHQAAVKAIAYCPWSKSLIATGGGTRDRNIRFWHSKTGTLLKSFKTEGQITSLVWSRNKKQIVLTFGFCEAFSSPILIEVYSYPKMEKLIQAEDLQDTRILSSVLSPEASCLCTALNDETVRFYDLWDAKYKRILETPDYGILGSDLIELTEGISKSGGSIR